MISGLAALAEKGHEKINIVQDVIRSLGKSI